MWLQVEPEVDAVNTLVPSSSQNAPSLFRSLVVATATVTLLALSLGALYHQSEQHPRASVSAQR